MSKMFSISLVTVMMFVSLMGAAPQAGFADISTPELNPTIEEAPTQEVLDQDEAIQEGEQVPVDVPTDVDAPIQEEQAPAPVEEPTEDANAPPADDNPVIVEEPVVDEPVVEPPVIVEEPVVVEQPVEQVEDEPVAKPVAPAATNVDSVEAPAGTDSDMVAPNAVDPNPGDCPVGEICDGGGEETPATVSVSITVRTMSNSGGLNLPVPVADATITITDDQNHVLGDKVTDANGVVAWELTSGKSYTVDLSKPGYDSVIGTAFTPTASNASLDLYLILTPPPSGTVTFNVTDSATNLVLPGAAVTLYQGSQLDEVDSGPTDDNGVWTSESVTGGSYVASIYLPGYTGQAALPVSVSGNQSIDIALSPSGVGSTTITVIDSVTREPLHFASVVFTDNPNGDYQSETDENGVMSFSDLASGTYSFTISEPGYATQVISVTVTSGQDTAITIELAHAGEEWPITIVNSITGAPVPNATVWLKIVNGGGEFAGRTNDNGVWTSPRIADGDYVLTVDHDDYVNIEDMAITKTAGAPAQVQMQPYLEGTVTMTVTELQTGAPINGATISVIVSNDDFSIRLTEYGVTNANGTWTSPTLPGGEHEYSVYAEGYQLKRGTVVIVTGSNSLSLEMDPSSVGQLHFQVIDAETREPIAGAQVTVALRGGYYLIDSGTTGQNGVWDGPKAGWAEFQITVEKYGFASYDNFRFIQGSGATILIELEPGFEHDAQFSVSQPGMTSANSPMFVVQPIAGMNPGIMPGIFTQVNGELVPMQGARIFLFDTWTNELYYETVTGENGTATINGVYGGRYLMTINADGMQQHREIITVGEGFTFELTMTPEEPETPTDPEPGDGDDETPTNPVPGDGGETPVDPVPTEPAPSDGNDTPTVPAPDNDDSDTSVDPVPSDGNGASVDPGQDDDSVDTNDGEVAEVIAENGDPIANDVVSQTGNTSTDATTSAQADRVSELPATGSGPSQSPYVIASMLLLAGLSLIGATAIRRHTR